VTNTTHWWTCQDWDTCGIHGAARLGPDLGHLATAEVLPTLSVGISADTASACGLAAGDVVHLGRVAGRWRPVRWSMPWPPWWPSRVVAHALGRCVARLAAAQHAMGCCQGVSVHAACNEWPQVALDALPSRSCQPARGRRPELRRGASGV